MEVSYISRKDKIVEKLIEIVGEKGVANKEYILAAYSRDASPEPPKRPEIIVKPTSTEEVSQVMKLANQNKIPVTPAGGRTSMCGASIPQKGGILLDLTLMNRILEVNEDELYVHVQCGITWGELIHGLKGRGYKLGFRGPYSGHASTVGGSFSSNSIGYGSRRWGQAPDGLNGLVVVLATGEIVNTGSSAMIYAGGFNRYNMGPDLTGIFCGDHGTLGVKTEAYIKIYPWPKAIKTLTIGFTDLRDACQFFWEVQKTQLTEDQIIIGETQILDIIFEGFTEMYPNLQAVIIVVVEEDAEEIAQAKMNQIRNLMAKYNGRSLGDMFSKLHWQHGMFEDISPFFQFGMWAPECHTLPTYKLYESIQDFKKIYRRLNLAQYGFQPLIAAMANNNNSVSMVAHIYYRQDKPEKNIAIKFWNDEMERILLKGGVPYWSGTSWGRHLKDKLDPQYLNLYKKFKETLDPNGILNPSILFGE